MNLSLTEILCCPKDHSDLNVYIIKTDEQNVETGFLRCPICHDIWTIIDGICRFVAPSSVDLQKEDDFAVKYQKDMNRLLEGSANSLKNKIKRFFEIQVNLKDWNYEEMVFWENYYSNRFTSDNLNRTTYNRLLPRKKSIIDRLKNEKIVHVLEIGCGTCGTLCHLPEFMSDKQFVGTDMSFNALKCAKKFIKGNFVMCDAATLPFKTESFDLILSFGMLHHHEQREQILHDLYPKVKKGGFIGFSEKILSHEKLRKSRFVQLLKSLFLPNEGRNHAEMEYIDLKNAISICQNYGSVINLVYEYSIIRDIFAKLFIVTLKLNKRFLTELIIMADHTAICLMGKKIPIFSGKGIHLLAKKNMVIPVP